MGGSTPFNPGDMLTLEKISQQLLAAWKELQALLKSLRALYLHVNFDIDGFGNAIASGTQLTGSTNPYPELTFSSVDANNNPTGRPVYAAFSPFDTSAPNIVSLSNAPAGGGDTDDVGAIQIGFNGTFATVSIEVKVSYQGLHALGPVNNLPFLAGYDQNKNQLGTSIFPTSSLPAAGMGVSSAVTLSVSGSAAGISYVTLHCPYTAGSNNLIAYWDNLVYGPLTA